MDAFAAIEQRYGFAIPELYRTLRAQGHFSLPWENHLSFYDCEWLTPEAIADYKFYEWTIESDGGFLPFAISGRHETYCWRLDWASGGEPPVVLCEHCEWAVCLAPDFRGLLYRLALEAFAGRNTFLSFAKVDELHRAVDILTPLLPAPWAHRLRDLRNGSWHEERGSLLVLPPAACEAIIADDLAFPHLNEKFIHDKEYLKRLERQS